MFFVYLITNQIDGRQYVGQTRNAVEYRIKEHVWKKTPIGRDIKELGRHNFSVEIIEVCFTHAEVDYWERFWIKELHTKFPNGYNKANGGNGSTGVICSEEVREKIAASKRGKPLSPEHRAAIASSNRGRKHPPEELEKMSAARRGKPLSAAHRAAISAGLKGKKKSPEWIAKQAAAQRGRKQSPESIAKAQATKEANGTTGRGVPKTPEHCAAMRRANAKPEVKARRSAASKAAHARRKAEREAAEREAAEHKHAARQAVEIPLDFD